MTMTWAGREVFALEWHGRGVPGGGGLFVRWGPWTAMLFNEEARAASGRTWVRDR